MTATRRPATLSDAARRSSDPGVSLTCSAAVTWSFDIPQRVWRKSGWPDWETIVAEVAGAVVGGTRDSGLRTQSISTWALGKIGRMRMEQTVWSRDALTMVSAPSFPSV